MKLTYALKIDGWFRWNFLLKCWLFRGHALLLFFWGEGGKVKKTCVRLCLEIRKSSKISTSRTSVSQHSTLENEKIWTPKSWRNVSDDYPFEILRFFLVPTVNLQGYMQKQAPENRLYFVSTPASHAMRPSKTEAVFGSNSTRHRTSGRVVKQQSKSMIF